MSTPTRGRTRPSADVPSKYEKELPSYIEDFFVYYSKLHGEGESLEDWQEDLVNQIANNLVESIQEHMKTSSKARRAFVSMNAESVWEDTEHKIMRITRRNLATFEQEYINQVDDVIKETIKSEIDPIREELLEIIEGIYVSEEEGNAVREFCSGNKFFFEDLAQHIVEREAWRTELQERLPVIRYVWQREEFVLRAIHFEEQDRNSSARKTTIAALNEGKRFRAAAWKTLEQTNKKVRELINDYQSRLNKAFEIRGLVYQNNLDAQDACLGKISTFQNYRRDFLVFLNSGNDEIEPLVTTPAIEAFEAEHPLTEVEFQDFTSN
eukprot:c21159_g1_i1.p1 GENE.c21159_g1_i1~~c21159_g1_i1.p1  ORF type:complete len:324 (+),score=75.18 c21159_g1_i1:40-1011(+)